jgi:hypothetical protein
MRRGAALARQRVEHADGVVGGDVARDQHGQRFAGELVDDVEQLDPAAGERLIELEVDRPHVIGPLGPEPVRRDRRFAQALAFAAPGRDPQAFLAPQPLHPLAVHAPALADQPRMRAPIAPPGPLHGDHAQRRPQRAVIGSDPRLAALRGARLTDDPACPALADVEAIAQHRDRSAPAGWAHQFPFATSFSARFSST